MRIIRGSADGRHINRNSTKNPHRTASIYVGQIDPPRARYDVTILRKSPGGLVVDRLHSPLLSIMNNIICAAVANESRRRRRLGCSSWPRKAATRCEATRRRGRCYVYVISLCRRRVASRFVRWLLLRVTGALGAECTCVCMRVCASACCTHGSVSFWRAFCVPFNSRDLIKGESCFRH